VIVAVEGYSARSATARVVAAERYLLETILHRPIMIKRMGSGMHGATDHK
jgi:hypothetical protein